MRSRFFTNVKLRRQVIASPYLAKPICKINVLCVKNLEECFTIRNKEMKGVFNQVNRSKIFPIEMYLYISMRQKYKCYANFVPLTLIFISSCSHLRVLPSKIYLMSNKKYH